MDWIDEIEDRLTAVSSSVSSPWHAGRTVGRTIYDGDGPDDLIGVMDSRLLAEFVAHAPNDIKRLIAEVRKLRRR